MVFLGEESNQVNSSSEQTLTSSEKEERCPPDKVVYDVGEIRVCVLRDGRGHRGSGY